MPFGSLREGIWWNFPEPYLIWFQQRWIFQRGKLGNLLRSMLEIKLNGLEGLN